MSKYNIYNSPTFRLMKNKPSFMEGFSGILNFSDIVAYYNTSDTEGEADINAIKSDWEAIGIDIKNTIKTNPDFLKHARE
jgi:ABC-type transport system substrate-binding protein